MTNSRFRFFVGASILVGGLLFKLGAPVPAIAAGLILAWTVVYRLERRSTRTR